MKKILIVDDDADIRDAIVTVLSTKYELRQADGKTQAIATLKTFTPDLVILDVMMESVSAGFELAREIKQSASSPKILMLTGVDKEMNLDFKTEAGNADWLPVDDYVTKPVVPKTLIEKIALLLG
jgi:DNA-binding response OmpR family regulator